MVFKDLLMTPTVILGLMSGTMQTELPVKQQADILLVGSGLMFKDMVSPDEEPVMGYIRDGVLNLDNLHDGDEYQPCCYPCMDIATEHYGYIDEISAYISDMTGEGYLPGVSLDLLKTGYINISRIWTYNDSEKRYELPAEPKTENNLRADGTYIIYAKFSTTDMQSVYQFSSHGLRFASSDFLHPFYVKIKNIEMVCPESVKRNEERDFDGWFKIDNGVLTKAWLVADSDSEHRGEDEAIRYFLDM